MAPRPTLSRPGSLQLGVAAAGSVIIRHPRLGNVLFLFPVYSDEPDPTHPFKPLVGVCHRLVLDACRIVTNHAVNNQEDFLAEDREGQTPVHIDDSKTLSARTYFYFLGPAKDASSRNYPIVKEFSAFIFPRRLPEHWYTARTSGRLTRGHVSIVSSTNMSVHVATRDQGCAATRYQSFTRCAYLVPEAEAAWFMANEMYVYSPGNGDARVNTHTNGISLRDDVHRCLESHAFVFYPAGNDQFMAYFVRYEGYPEYTELLHRRLVTIHPSVAVEFLYARFAYAVIHIAGPKEVFESVPDNPAVKLWEEKLALSEAEKQARKDAKLLANIDYTSSETSVSDNSQALSGRNGDSALEESYVDEDTRWRERLLARLPQLATLDDVEHPPDDVACHTESPHMLRLKSEYMRENPQVWRTSATPEGTTREDSEGFLAGWMTRPP
ncbi:hypothetical protein V8D89_004694 [Ganoderma adspersum]